MSDLWKSFLITISIVRCRAEYVMCWVLLVFKENKVVCKLAQFVSVCKWVIGLKDPLLVNDYFQSQHSKKTHDFKSFKATP